MSKESDIKNKDYHELVERVLGDAAEVRSLTPETILVCKDLDEITTKVDILKALEDQFGLTNLQDFAVKNIRKAYGL